MKYNQNNKLNNLSFFTTPRAQLDLLMIHTAHPFSPPVNRSRYCFICAMPSA